MTDFPTSLAARRCIHADPEGCAASIGWTVTRALSIAAGFWLAGEREKLWPKALAGSLAVEAFVVGWSATHLNEPVATLPSATAAASADPAAIVFTYLARSVMVYTGLMLAGYKQHALRNALAGTAAIELAVLSWAHQNASRPLSS
jgi:hypothetical protein